MCQDQSHLKNVTLYGFAVRLEKFFSRACEFRPQGVMKYWGYSDRNIRNGLELVLLRA